MDNVPTDSADIHLYMSSHLEDCISLDIPDTEYECGIRLVNAHTDCCTSQFALSTFKQVVFACLEAGNQSRHHAVFP